MKTLQSIRYSQRVFIFLAVTGYILLTVSFRGGINNLGILGKEYHLSNIIPLNFLIEQINNHQYFILAKFFINSFILYLYMFLTMHILIHKLKFQQTINLKSIKTIILLFCYTTIFREIIYWFFSKHVVINIDYLIINLLTYIVIIFILNIISVLKKSKL